MTQSGFKLTLFLSDIGIAIMFMYILIVMLGFIKNKLFQTKIYCCLYTVI